MSEYPHHPQLDKTCFDGYFKFPESEVLLENFCIYHIDAPGQVNCKSFLQIYIVFKSKFSWCHLTKLNILMGFTLYRKKMQMYYPIRMLYTDLVIIHLY